MKWFLRIFPAVVLVAAALAYAVGDSKRAAGILLGAGAVVWLGVGAVSIGSEIEPSDRGPNDG
ncbi:MAG: hypothetical protein IT379_20740 [Deltaproteobacteria bacterium]|nr:hypothetical protein [Deltaproteobacteria bacterium]